VRKGARVIKEIAWRWREIGADARICDLIDSQVSAIEAGCGRVSSDGPRGALSAAFDLIEARIAAFDDSDDAPAEAEERAPQPSPAAPPDEISVAVAAPQTSTDDVAETEMRAAAMPAAEAVASAEAAEMTVDKAAATADVMATASEASAEATDMTAETLEAPAEIVDATGEASDVPVDDLHTAPADADAHDEAVLEMVALEMAAADPDEADDVSGIADVPAVETVGIQPAEIRPTEIQTAGQPSAEPEIVARTPEPVAAPVQPESVPTSLQTSLQPSAEASSADAAEPSLGASLLASGLLRRPRASSSDPLAPIRRMSQAEKIAFFS
jgi:hypothetical protein